MKKIVFLLNHDMLPVPSIKGGAIEELLTILLEENEKSIDHKYEFYFVSKKDTHSKNNLINYNYKNSKIILTKYNKFINICIKSINKILRCLKINFQLPNIYYYNALKEILKINPNLVICEGGFDSYIKRISKKIKKSKMVFHVHHQVQEKKDISKYFNSVISVSNFISNDWENFIKEKSLNYYVLPNTVNESRFNKKIDDKTRNNIRMQYGFNNDDFIVIFCGRIIQEKGIKELCNAILRSHEQTKLLIVGGSSINKKSKYFTSIEDLSKKNSHKIKMTGYIKNEDLYKIYQSADIQVIPSLWEEAAGLVVIEGQLSGLPQIITNSGGMVEYANPNGSIIINKDNTIEFELENSIELLRSNTHLRHKMSNENILFSTVSNKYNYYKNFLDIVETILNTKE